MKVGDLVRMKKYWRPRPGLGLGIVIRPRALGSDHYVLVRWFDPGGMAREPIRRLEVL